MVDRPKIKPQAKPVTNMPPIIEDEEAETSTNEVADETGLVEAAIAAAQEAQRAAPQTLHVDKPGVFVPNPRSVAAPFKTVRRIKIILEESESIPPTGLFLCVNGNTYMCQAGVEVAVPPDIINALNDAIMSVPIRDPVYGKVIGYKDRLRFPYRVVSQMNQRAT